MNNDDETWCSGAYKLAYPEPHLHAGVTITVCPDCRQYAPVDLMGRIRPHHRSNVVSITR